MGASVVDGEVSDDASSASTDTLSRWSSSSIDDMAACASDDDQLMSTAASHAGTDHHNLQAAKAEL